MTSAADSSRAVVRQCARLAALALVVVCLLVLWRPSGSGVVSFGGPIMGTKYTVKLARPAAHIDVPEVKAAVRERLEAINSLMSTYLADSDVSRLSRHDGTDWFPVSAETARVIDAGLRIGALSGGSFDITIAPLVDLWGFGPESRRPEFPTDAEIAAALETIGTGKIIVRLDPPAVRKTDARVRVDLSGVAKGYAVDEVARYLDSMGCHDYMVDIGGELKTRGENDSGAPWVLGIVSPLAERLGVTKSVHLSGAAMATSGDYRNFFVRDGRRYSHTIDPRTGRPVTHALASVSVVAASCMEADALATALLVLGPEAGYALAEREKLAAFFIVRDAAGGFFERATRAMPPVYAVE